jgi:hypothetical protein
MSEASPQVRESFVLVVFEALLIDPFLGQAEQTNAFINHGWKTPLPYSHRGVNRLVIAPMLAP